MNPADCSHDFDLLRRCTKCFLGHAVRPSVAETRDCALCGNVHEVIGTVGGVKIITCERVREFGNFLGVTVSSDLERLVNPHQSDAAIGSTDPHSSDDTGTAE